MKEPYVLVFVGLFIVALVYRLFRGLSIGKRLGSSKSAHPMCADVELNELVESVGTENGKAREVLKKIVHKASSVDSSQLRAAYKCAAGNLALSNLKRPNLAVGLYLRALRESPRCVEALDNLQEILTAQKRLRRLEWTYWDVLGRLDEGQTGSEMWLKCWSGLASVYSVSPKKVRRADAIRRSISAYGPDADADAETNGESSIRILESNGSKPQ